MLPPDFLAALDNLPPEEALHRPANDKQTSASRVSALLGGGEQGQAAEPVTIGDVLFRWARTEPDSLMEADVPGATHLSDILRATGRLPRRFGFSGDLARAALAESAAVNNYLPWDVRGYLLNRLVAHIHEAQGCEAVIGWSGDSPEWLLINGLGFAVQDPDADPPTLIERLTLVPQDFFSKAFNLTQSPFVYSLMGVSSSMLGGLLPGPGAAIDMLWSGLQVSTYAVAAAQAARIALKRDTDAITKLASLGSAAAASHFGLVAGHAAGLALFGVAGSWLVILAPIATSAAGGVLARNFARRARFRLMCRNEVIALHAAISLQCTASRDVLERNILTTKEQALRFIEMRQTATPQAQVVVANWLERIEHIQSYRMLVASRLHRAVADPGTLDQRDGDPLAAAYESLLICARAGIHPANVVDTSKGLVAAGQALQKKMSLALI
jgi:hypothetical protein